MKKTLLSFFLILPFLLSPITTFSLAIQLSLSGTIVATTPQSISDHVYYLSESVNGKVTVNGGSTSINITSVSTFISGLGLPPLPLDGVPIAPPQAIGDNIYFVYVPGVTSIPNGYRLNETYLAYANYTNGSWHIKNVITNGIVSDFSVCNNSVYALWKSSPAGETYLLLISQNRVISNVSIDVVNASTIEVSNGVGVISNASLNFTQDLVGLHTNTDYFVINLSTGRVLYQIPNYNNVMPNSVSVSNGIGLVTYVQSASSSYLVLLNLSTGKIISERSFNEVAVGFINNGFILVEEEQTSGNNVIETFSIYNMSWGLLYHETMVGSESSLYDADGLLVNSTGATILLTHVSTQVNIFGLQVTISSSLEFNNALQAPQPFTIYVSELHYPGYTILKISWNENQPDTYLVYINNSLVGQTKGESMEYNVTENGTYLIKIIAGNPLGRLEENATINVTVYSIQKTTSSSSATSSSSTTITSSSTTTPIATTYTFTYTNQSSTIVSSNTSITTALNASHTIMVSILPIIAIVVIVIAVALLLLLVRRK